MMRSTSKAGIGLLLCLVLATPTAATASSGCTDSSGSVQLLSLTVEGEQATGRYVLPADDPVGLVAFSHGYGHTSASWGEHMQRTADELGVIALAMDYRGTVILDPEEEVPSSRGWRVAEGAADTIAAAQHFDDLCPGMGTFVNFGVSMGGNTSGLIAASGAQRTTTNELLFPWWINVEGVSNVIETYLAASALAPVNDFAAAAAEDIEEAMGGTLVEQPGTYLERTVVTRAPDIKAAGVKGVWLVHGVDDGLVPYNQSLEMVTALRAVDVPTSFSTVLRRDPKHQDTTITGTILTNVDPSYRSPLAGHASETSAAHPVMAIAFAKLADLLNGAELEQGCHAEEVYDVSLSLRGAACASVG